MTEPRPSRISRLFGESVGDFVSNLLEQEALGGFVLTAALLLGVLWASLWSSSFDSLVNVSIHIPYVPRSIVNNVSSLVTNLVMIIFFGAIGLEIARERAVGTLRDTATAVAPVVAALCGMAMAALIFVLVALIDGDHAALAGWGIPMATDVAFTLGAISLLGSRVSHELRIFILTLAVADDVASVVVLGATTHGSSVLTHGATGVLIVIALLTVAAGLVARRLGLTLWVYVGLAIVLWWALAQLDIEPTLAGVIIGVLVPNGHARTLPGPRLERVVAPLSTFLVLPLFALIVGGVDLATRPWRHQGGLILALVAARSLGKVIGIVGGVALVVTFNVGKLPKRTSWGQMAGAALLCGIGFTVPLLFATAAFGEGSAMLATTKVGLLLASLGCGVLGLFIIAKASPSQSTATKAEH